MSVSCPALFNDAEMYSTPIHSTLLNTNKNRIFPLL